MTVEVYQTRAAIELFGWIRRDPERAFETGVKVIAFGAAIAILAAFLSE
jgi:hypothetical protein